MAMHVHSSFSEGGSWAAGGGGASMMAQLDQATRNGVDVVWWTDHDWRMNAYGYFQEIGFDGTPEGGKLTWTRQVEGSLAAGRHAFVADPHSTQESGRALQVEATAAGQGWSTCWLWAKAGNSFYSTNLSDTTLTVDVLGEQLGPDAELVVQLETSNRPATADRPAGLYLLEYRVGLEDGRSLDTPLTGVVTTRATGGWQTLTMDPVADVRRFWPDLVAGDTGLARIRFGVRVREGATGRACFDRFRFLRGPDIVQDPVTTQRELMDELATRYPQVTQALGSEVSMIRHMNVYMTDFELYPYPPTGKAPSLDPTVEGAQRVVDWYHDRGALVQYNHPETTVEEFVATRALGADLVEVPGEDDEVVAERLALFDAAARNAVFLTATSQLDDHAGRDWAGLRHGFVTSAWADSTEVPDLLEAMAAGRLWSHHLSRAPQARMDLVARGRSVMGQVLRTQASVLPLELVAQGLPEGTTLEVVVGLCDRTGATEPAVERHAVPVPPARGRPTRFLLERAGGRYLRVEARDADGSLLAMGNPVWLLPSDADVVVPPARRSLD
ncbi:hypothetical protein SAMN04489747_0283 [Auraticoccus monumenti]|uniref:PHP domain-containing protein n=2 Tax=Auraticoccus monumenti TaxID=675864 RepID=A0A1G6SBR3_9ACTN|nr:hypothetical protein SAMN04489747_0283 [Auraticoccus monumenti]